MSTHRLDVAALHRALDVVRRCRRLEWQQIATESGADGLVALVVWLRHGDTIRPYVTTADGQAVDAPAALESGICAGHQDRGEGLAGTDE
jgi:hypothetical protein